MKSKWDKEKLRHMISEVYHANEEQHPSSAVINGTTDFLDDVHNETLQELKKKVEGMKSIGQLLPGGKARELVSKESVIKLLEE